MLIWRGCPKGQTFNQSIHLPSPFLFAGVRLHAGVSCQPARPRLMDYSRLYGCREVYHPRRRPRGEKPLSWKARYASFLKSKQWDILRTVTFERDGHKCTKCGSPNDLHAHHTVYRAHPQDTQPGDLITLCLACHRKQHPDKGAHVVLVLDRLSAMNQQPSLSDEDRFWLQGIIRIGTKGERRLARQILSRDASSVQGLDACRPPQMATHKHGGTNQGNLVTNLRPGRAKEGLRASGGLPIVADGGLTHHATGTSPCRFNPNPFRIPAYCRGLIRTLLPDSLFRGAQPTAGALPSLTG
jgi:5-methylcytosine-specific restriction endonuclease McrA